MRNRGIRAKSVARAKWWTYPVLRALLNRPEEDADESYANGVFVEAAKLIQAAGEEAVATRKLDLLKDAKRKLEAIVDRHPSSRLAVELVSGQKIGTVSLPGLVEAIEDAAVLASEQALDPTCWLPLAVATAEKIENAYVLADIARTQTESGDVRKAGEILAVALAVTEKTKITWARDSKLADIAKAQAEAGYFKEALTSAEKIEDAGSRSRAFADIAKAQAKAGYFEEALATVEKIEDDRDRTRAVVEVAGAQVRAGHFKEAFATVNSIRYAGDRAEAFARIAVTVTEAD